MSERGDRSGWYAYPPDGHVDTTYTDEPVGSVQLRDGDPEAGPF